ncbi:hypothetical protein EVG20_g7118 [Dentipellis fragilis]|uniref:DNA replication factor Cdt1 C-terminal domain-containing protein n=1 Tax=Dentipellis fragilis TaxID=205917 RepID=A0A4Y9YHT3_9AGAM|nr:hypothetical protein EVG20_g7118 [Dentipellis fragilis]
MSDLYTALRVSPRKKRCLSEDEDDMTLTPKRLRIAPPSPPKSSHKATPKGKTTALEEESLPPHLSRLYTIQTALQHALSHALATCAVSPSSGTGIVRNVVNLYSLNASSALRTKFDIDDLRRLCWLWEWDGNEASMSSAGSSSKKADDDNPFLEEEAPATPKDWTRGSMGFVVNPTSHFSKLSGSRVPTYGVGIEVEIDIDKDMGSGMAAVARWTSASETRRREVLTKLHQWAKIHSNMKPMPNIHMADLPQLITPAKPSTLTRLLASSSPKSPSSISILATPPSPSSSRSSRSPTKSPVKRSSASRDFAIPFPITPGSKGSSLFPQTPSRRARGELHTGLLTPRTPSLSPSRSDATTDSLPSTPVHQRGADASTAPQTPTSSRRQALYDRIRQKELTSTPSKTPRAGPSGAKLSKAELIKLGQDELKRRVQLGRLGGVADSVWMLFSAPTSTTGTPTTRKRRALPASEVAAAVVKSSPVPISTAEALESLNMLTSLCPFFLKPLNIGSDEWLEMPASSQAAVGSGPKVPPSPGSSRSKGESAEEIVTRSPRRVRREGGGLREVRERIRRELESQD